ncbi:MAG: glycosyltransferase family 2 protein [Pseudobdellovibrio sp.]
MKICIFVPCYNCENQVERTLQDLDSILPTEANLVKILIIDNCSTDSTIASATRAIASLRHSQSFSVYRNYENAGLGGSHKIAFSIAKELKATHLLVFHGDHQAKAQDIPELLKFSISNGEATVLGSRFQRRSKLSGYSPIRTAGNLVLNRLYSLITRTDISDLGSGLNLFKIEDIDFQKLENFDNGFTFNMDLLLYLVKSKKDFRYFPIHWSTSDQISNAHALIVGLKTVNKLVSWILERPLLNKNHSGSEKLL